MKNILDFMSLVIFLIINFNEIFSASYNWNFKLFKLYTMQNQ